MAKETHLPLPAPFSHHPSSPDIQLISQGAEALLLRTPFLSTTAAVKYRPPKPYRHSTLDRRLTRARILAEARLLLKCAKAGVKVPAVLGLAAEEGWVALSWVPGRTVKEVLRGWKGEDREEEVRRVLTLVGQAVGALHKAGVVHGDLTSSNMMLAPGSSIQDGKEGEEGEELVLIDFGLAALSSADEDRAVDLYVLERAFGSTHPELEEVFNEVVWGAYGGSYKGAKVVLKRLEDVRMRGRKKSMLG
ncbi:serine/threonine-protein kinase bud32 [Myriangium duriaei CBS 260.36]|uniref:EKC/KEOPS complex subunit BUD32 n=1 Tax=Myriangium duriaei CBS 260.36 TaxID=1168546 RepID=A0A9P4MKT6_9PEZI|nr:serine/threonine-protein kinase bud32 [Myriangium duriaei CBS 260.36]